MAIWKGLEPSTSRVTGECSNQLSYQTIELVFITLHCNLIIVHKKISVGDEPHDLLHE